MKGSLQNNLIILLLLIINILLINIGVFICTSEEDLRSHGTIVTDDCEYWELNPSPLEEKTVVLTPEILF